MNNIFIPHPAIDDHFQINEQYIIRTSDLDQYNFKWSRVISKNYIKQHGLLCFNENERITLSGYYRENEDSYLIEVEEEIIYQALIAILPEQGFAIIHYSPENCVMCVVIGVQREHLVSLPEQYLEYYYDRLR